MPVGNDVSRASRQRSLLTYTRSELPIASSRTLCQLLGVTVRAVVPRTTIAPLTSLRCDSVDHSQGGAQQAFEDLCRNFERAGWELERRVFDGR